MPVYIKIDSKNFGTITQKTGSTSVAGRNSNIVSPLTEDFCLTYDWGIKLIQPHNDNFGAAEHSQAALETEVTVKIPMYHSIPALLLNVMANKDEIKTLSMYEVDRSQTGGQQVTRMGSTFTNGIVTEVEVEQGDQRKAEEKGRGHVIVKMKFQEVQYDDKVINVSGHLDTTNAA